MRMKKKFLCVALSAMMLLPTIPASAKSKVSIVPIKKDYLY